jgi:hypothetical protein
MGEATNKFFPEVRARAVRMVLDHAGEHPSRFPTSAPMEPKWRFETLRISDSL